MKTRPLVSAALALAVAAAASTAGAQDDTQRRLMAQQLFDEASKLMDKKTYDEACPKLEEVLKLTPGKIGALMALGECYEGGGKFASAWARYRAAADAAETANDARLAQARAKVEAVAPKLSHVTITVSPEAKAAGAIEVQRDGVPVGAPFWGSAIAVDAGHHVVKATVAGKAPFTKEFDLTPSAKVTVAIPAFEAGGAAAAPTPDNGATPPPGAPPKDEGGAPPSGTPTWAIGFGVAAIGLAVGGGTFIGLGVRAGGELDKCKAPPAGQVCNDQGTLSGAQGRDFGLGAGFGGAALIAGGIAIYGIVSSPKKPAAGSNATVWTALSRPIPWGSKDAGGVSVAGHF